MVETDWREILSFSQRELNEGDKDKLCESLCWMEADDIELNFTDLKTLFRLAQDILKYKSEQVNSLLGQLETTQRKQKRRRSKTSLEDSPARSSDSVFEAITHQEEIIKANKDILEQLYSDIAELEKRKKTIEIEKSALDKDSDSSREPLSEMNAIEQLENELVMKNRHIRKLLTDVKHLQDENSKLNENAAVFQDKLKEATQVFDGYTKQIQKHNQDYTQLKEALVSAEETKSELLLEIEVLQNDLADKETKMNNSCDEIKNQVQHWKNIAKSKKAAIEVISKENIKLKEKIEGTQAFSVSPKKNDKIENHSKELKEKLSEAVDEMNESSRVIETLRTENNKLKDKLKNMDLNNSMPETKNDSDDSKQRDLIRRQKQEIIQLTESLRQAENTTESREMELAEISKQLQLLQSGEVGLNELLQSLKTTKRQLKLKDEGVKSLVQEVNSLNNVIDNLQMQNEAMRLKFNLPLEENIPTEGVVTKYHEIRKNAASFKKGMMKMENKLVSAELENREIRDRLSKLLSSLQIMGVPKDKIDHVLEELQEDDLQYVGKEGNALMSKEQPKLNKNFVPRADMDAIIDENEGLRKGLTEILEFIKNSSTDSTGVLAVQCPSLEAVLTSMEARHSSGWFAPHMAAVLELKSALGGRDALLTALCDARKETLNVISQLKEETQRTQDLERKLQDVQSTNESQISANGGTECDFDYDFGKSWMESKMLFEGDFSNKSELEDVLNKTRKPYNIELRKTLNYFHRKFENLFHKMTSIAMKHADEKNEWAIQEEKYKAEIQNMCSMAHTDDEKNVDSPGRINPISVEKVQKKSAYLEESYKYIRTINENLKQVYLESQKEIMILTADYEIKMQKLVLSLATITDKLRNSISLDMFWKQNESLNSVTLKYNKLVNERCYDKFVKTNLLDMLERNKFDILKGIQNHTKLCNESSNQDTSKLLANVESAVLVQQVESLCTELEVVNNKITVLQEENYKLQQIQQNIIRNTLENSSKDELDFVKNELLKTKYEYKIIKEQCTHVTNQLDIALKELHDMQQKHFSNDIEVNMLRHQILDLQTAGDNKAIIARLSGEILVAHLQSAEYHEKIEATQLSLRKETQKRIEIEEMLQSREKIFHIYSQQYESKFRYLFEIMETFRHQYQGIIPLVSIENYLNQTEEVYRKTKTAEEKLDAIEDIRSNLMIKHSVYDQIISMYKAECLDTEEVCPHQIELSVKDNLQLLENNECKKRIQYLEQTRENFIRQYNCLENKFILINQCFKKQFGFSVKKSDVDMPSLEVQDIQSDDEESSKSSGTVTLPEPLLLKSPKAGVDMTNVRKQNFKSLPGSPKRILKEEKLVHELVNTFVQTTCSKSNKNIQTDPDKEMQMCKKSNESLEIKYVTKEKEFKNVVSELNSKTEEVDKLSKIRSTLETKIENLKGFLTDKENLIEDLQNMLTDIRNELEIHRNDLQNEKKKQKIVRDEENSFLLETIKQLENDKVTVVDQYKAILNKERDEYLISTKELNSKIIELKTQLLNQTNDTTNSSAEKDEINKDTLKIIELQDKCFRLESQLDGNRSEMQSYKSEIERWKELASERLTKMEQLNNQFQERYSQEVDSYKAENQHWLTQLNETQKEHMDLRSRLSDQKNLFLKQLSEKDSQIEQLRNVIHNLKSQMVGMHTMMSATDPSFDLSAIVEADDSGSERLEIRFNSTPELGEDAGTLPTTSTAIWQEPAVERLRRERQLTCKQNGLLRRQVRALAARERRARLEAQNLQSQVYRVSASGRAAEGAPLQAKVAALQAQLAGARRDSHAGLALWDKWKRAQQNADRWQSRYEEQCQEVKKLEAALGFAKSAVARLEKEKRTLLSRLHDSRTPAAEKHDLEGQEKERPERERPGLRDVTPDRLAARVEAQQRRIAALEIAEKGNEPLVSEYEKSLAEIALLKGQLLKLESALLETQLKASFSTAPDLAPELEYWKSYSGMLKEENLQLSARLGARAAGAGEGAGAAGAHRVAELEKTVLTLRGLVSKLQAEQKCSPKRSVLDPKDDEKNKLAVQLSGCRTEVANLRRALADKERLLQRSRELLKVAADREDELLAENDYLRRQIRESRAQYGSLSA